MSLKTFHITFIALSALVAFFFGVWLLYRGLMESEGLMVAGGLVSFGAGVGLIYYGVHFIRKLKHAGIY